MSPSRFRTLQLLVCLIGLAVPSRAQLSRCFVELEETTLATDYFRIVDLYRTPVYGQSLVALRRLTEELDLNDVDPREAFESLTGLMTVDWRPSDRCLEAAAMMHGELAMEDFDARQYIVAELHFGVADELMTLISDRELHERFVRNWLLALGYFMQKSMYLHDAEHATGAFVMALRYYDDAVERFGDDGEILVAAGALYESSGTFRAGEKKHLANAEKLYARAVVAAPLLAEAQLRYGRVLEKRGRYRDAEAPVAKAIELDESVHVTYIARLIAGRLAERDGRLEEAIRQYESAIPLLPGWQIATIALSHVLHEVGRREESAKILAESIRARPTSQKDSVGWWIYELGRSARLESLWQHMRQETQF